MQTTSRKQAGRFIVATAMAAASMLGAVGNSMAEEMGDRSNIAYIGADIRDNSHYPYIGLIHHFSGDVMDDGILLRVGGYRAEYEYNTGTQYDATATAAEVLVGYQRNTGDYIMRGYIGLDYSDHDITPANPADSNSGSDTGVKVQGEIESDYAARNYFGVIAMYGSAKHNYWARARAGHNFNGNILGVEGFLIGDREFDERRIGVFLTKTDINPLTFSLSAGYSDSGDTRGGNSGYATIELSTLF